MSEDLLEHRLRYGLPSDQLVWIQQIPNEVLIKYLEEQAPYLAAHPHPDNHWSTVVYAYLGSALNARQRRAELDRLEQIWIQTAKTS